ncbi:MAG TPA: M28 family metallopeptidase [Candidatus Polarisedimenticolia bacterium]|nr:M28 family metallopeptidase [Candidatus Polarisedimenticolia bacterium]
MGRNGIAALACIAVGALGLAAAAAARPAPAAGAPAVPATDPGIYGFRAGSLAAERQAEALLLQLPEAERVERHARILTEDPHVAGTPENERVARYIFERFKEAGLTTEMKTYSVYMGYVTEALLEQLEPQPELLTHPEDGFEPDKDTFDPRATLNWNAYSPSCDLRREVVYVNYARPEDFAALDALGVAVKDRVLLARYFSGYRGGKALEAQKRGAAGIVFYSDPADDGFAQGEVYPEGPWGPESHFQRGAVVYDFLVPGDPLTPGWASLPQARRIRPEESEILPKIPSLPIAWRDALVILRNLAGPVVPHGFQGGMPVTYHVGPGPSRVHMKIDALFERRTITNVIGVLRGAQEPDRKVILGNHHDAWVYGAVDPSSGTATMLELARVAGEMARRGWRPRRTLVFGNWDAEEWTLTGSTEWGEEFRDDLLANGVACLNVDSSASGPRFQASAVPTLRRLISEALRDVPDPRSGRDLYAATAAAADQRAAFKALYYEGGAGGGGGAGVTYDILGSGSDYTVFFNHIGIPSLDASFEGPYGVYHSTYDDYFWMSHFGDPGFLYHTAMVRLWGMMAWRMANADVLPLEESPYPADVAGYLADLGKGTAGDASAPGAPAALDLGDLKGAVGEWAKAAADLDRGVTAVLSGAPHGATASPKSSTGEGPDAPDLAAVNAALMKAERDLLNPAGIPKRPWFRHLIYAPLPTYAAETLPGLREAIADGDAARARSQAALLAAAVRARVATLRRATAALPAAAPGAAQPAGASR